MSERRQPRALTLTLPEERRPVLILGDNQYGLRNLSENGLGVWVPAPIPAAFAVGSIHQGSLLVQGRVYPITVEVRHQDEKRQVGFRIVNKSAELASVLKELLEPALLASGLRVNAASGEDRETGYFRLWFEGQQGAELVIWHAAGGRIVALAIAWRSHSVFRQQGQPIVTGDIEGGPQSESRQGWPFEAISAHSSPRLELIRQAGQFLSAVPAPLPGHLLWQFLETGEQVYLPPSFLNETKVA